MPIYEYECRQCALRFEVRRGFSENGGGTCPRCGGAGRQVFFAPPLIFKGGGFYITESRKKSEPAPKPDASQPAAKPEASKPVKPDPTK